MAGRTPAIAPGAKRSGQVGRKILQDAANTLPHMIMSERLGHGDLETVAELPDGTIAIDLLTCEARRGGVPVSLEIVQLQTEWLADRLGRHGVARCDLAEARMELELRTDALPTDRSRTVPFDWTSTCRLATYDGKIKTGRAGGRVW